MHRAVASPETPPAEATSVGASLTLECAISGNNLQSQEGTAGQSWTPFLCPGENTVASV